MARIESSPLYTSFAMSTRGVVVASSEVCADAGVETLRAGGNVVDAAIAAVFATSAGDFSITSLAGGGVLTFHDASQKKTTVCDLFANAPGLGSKIDTPPSERDDDFRAYDVHFHEGDVVQTFHVGRAAAAPPGVLRGIIEIVDRFGSLPLRALVAPTVRASREGVEINAYQSKCFGYLRGILHNSELGRTCLFDENDELLPIGSHFRNTDLADTLEALSRGSLDDARAFVQNEIYPRVLEAFGEDAGGRITPRDIEEWKPLFRDALRTRYRDATIDMNPAPSFGGPSVAHTLRLFNRVAIEETAPDTSDRYRRLAAIFRTISELRAEDTQILDRPDAGQRFAERLDAIMVETADEDRRTATEPRSPGNTTHVSVADERGNAVAVTLSHGEGNGHEIPGTGIFMNNLLGESDLFPGGFGKYEAGKRLSTMMNPAIVLRDEGSVIALGSGGANRIRTAIPQVLLGLLVDDLEPQAAVDAARLHFESGVLSAETFLMARGREALEDAAPLADKVDAFESPGLYFGGVHVARRAASADVQGAGDARRNGKVRHS